MVAAGLRVAHHDRSADALHFRASDAGQADREPVLVRQVSRAPIGHDARYAGCEVAGGELFEHAHHQYAFVHVLVRDVGYGQIPRVARADKHLQRAKMPPARHHQPAAGNI